MTVLGKAAASALRKAAIEKSEQTTQSVIELAEVLWRTYYDQVNIGGNAIPLWEAWDYKSWYDYVERELGIHQSTAAGFRRIHEVFNVDLAGSWDKAKTPSYTKLKILARVVTKANVNSWLIKASKLSCCELEDEAMHYLYGRKRSGRLHNFVAYVTKTELRKIKEVIETARGDFEDMDRRGEVLVKVLEEWQNIHKRTRKLRVVKSKAA